MVESEIEYDSAGDGYITPVVTPEKKPCDRKVQEEKGKKVLKALLQDNIPISNASTSAKPFVVSIAEREISPTYLRETALPLLEQGQYYLYSDYTN